MPSTQKDTPRLPAPEFLVEVFVLSGARAGEKLGRFDPVRLRLGSGEDQDLRLAKSEGVAAAHAEIQRTEGQFLLVDSGSGAGTYALADERLVRRLPLDPITLIRLGQGGPRCRVQVSRTFPFGRYLITGRIGGGGMAEVFAARGPGHLGRSVALKVVHPELFAVPSAVEMFLAEARIAAQISHHNVVKIFDVGEEDGVLYIAMEHLRAVTLHHLRAQLAQRHETMPPDLAAALLAQALRGLHAAHELHDEEGRPLRVVHRDISPSNLLCTSEGLVVVIDFGIARAEQPLHESLRGLKGKPAYMSPEQIGSGEIDRRTDVFAAAVVLHELCTGEPLFQRENIMATLEAVLAGQAPPLRAGCRAASAHLEDVVRRALSPQRESRPESAAAFAAELDQVVAEYGGRFAQIAAAARHFSERGIDLAGAPPMPLTDPPATLSRARAERTIRHGAAPAPSTAEGGRTERLPLPTDTAADLLQIPPLPFALEEGRFQVLRPLPPRRPAAARVAPFQVECLVAQLRRSDADAGTLRDAHQAEVALYLIDGPRALREEALTRLRQHRAPTLAGIAAVLAVGQAWSEGPLYLAQPLCPQTLLSLTAKALTPRERVGLAQRLFALLASAARVDPGYCHGDLRPANLGLLPGAGGQREVLLTGVNFDRLLPLQGGPVSDAVDRERRSGAVVADPYLAPELRAGMPPDPRSDVFAAGAMIYELLGGSLAAVAAQGPSRQLAPRLPPQPELPVDGEAALLAALRDDPQARPSSAELALAFAAPQRSAPPTAQSPAAAVVTVPASGALLTLESATGHHLQIHTLELHPARQRDPAPLPLPSGPGLLPIALLVSMHASALVVDVDERAARASPRLSLYHDAHDPGTRCEGFVIAPSTDAARFDVGHRKVEVQHVRCVSAYNHSDAAQLQVAVPEFGLTLAAAGAPRRLAVLYFTDLRTRAVHVACIVVHQS